MTRPARRAPAPSAVRRLLALLAALLLAAGCGGTTDGAEPASAAATGTATDARPTLRVGELGSVAQVEALFAAAGEDADLPYDIESSLFPGGGPPAIEAMNAGAVDIAMMADTPPIFAKVNDAPISIVAALRQASQDAATVSIVVAPDSPVQSVADLRGARVSVTNGTILQYTVLRALEAAGLSYDDIEAVNLPPTDGITALERGDVDAAAVLGPVRSAALVGGAAREIANGAGITANLSILVAADAALDDPAREPLIADYVQRYARAIQWQEANRGEWAGIFAELSGLPAAVSEDLHERTSAVPALIDDEVIAGQQEQADAYHALGLLPQRLDVTEQFDDRYNELLAELLAP